MGRQPRPSPPTAAPELRQPNPTASPSPASQPQAPLVLLADDHPVNLKLYGNLLQHVGYRSLIAHTGAEAIQLATSHRPDLILMDIQMPDLDGIEATSQITHAPQTAGIPIICITSFAMPQDRERCFAAGARAYFCKPVNLAQLSKVMADLLKFPAGAPSPHPPA
jgi:CheY-like chemotaxis protein